MDNTEKTRETRKRGSCALALAVMLVLTAFSAAGCSKNSGETAEETAGETAEETAVRDTAVMTVPKTGAAQAAVTEGAEAQESVTQESVTQESIAQESVTQTAAEAPALLSFSLSQYERNYPGIGTEPMGIASAELLTLETPGYEKLAAAIDSINTVQIRLTDDAFRNLTEGFRFAELRDWEKPMLPYSEHRVLTLRRGDSVLVSYTLTADFWTGGAHPNYWMETFNIDPVTGGIIPLKDFVEDYDGFYGIVKEKLENSEEAEGFFEDWQETLKETFYGEYEPAYYVTDDAVFVYFDVYLLGPYAMGPVYAEFPLREYRQLFRARYFPENMPEDAEPVSQRVKSENSSAVAVSDLIAEAGEYTDNCGNTAEYRYKLPRISLTAGSSAYVDQVNEEIGQLKKEYVDTGLASIQKGCSPDSRIAVWRSVCYKGITSVFIEVDTDYDIVKYYCYNFKADGSKAKNKDVFEAFGMTEAEFEARAKEAMAARLGYKAGRLPDNSEMGKYDRKTLKGVTSQVPVLIAGADRSLRFVGRAYLPAGAGYYESVLTIPGTEHRRDGLEELQLNPRARENIKKEGDAWYIRDAEEETWYTLNEESIVAHTVPAFEYGDTVDSWMQRYLSEETISGFAAGDIIYVLVDETGYIEQIEAIYYWD